MKMKKRGKKKKEKSRERSQKEERTKRKEKNQKDSGRHPVALAEWPEAGRVVGREEEAAEAAEAAVGWRQTMAAPKGRRRRHADVSISPRW